MIHKALNSIVRDLSKIMLTLAVGIILLHASVPHHHHHHLDGEAICICCGNTCHHATDHDGATNGCQPMHHDCDDAPFEECQLQKILSLLVISTKDDESLCLLASALLHAADIMLVDYEPIATPCVEIVIEHPDTPDASTADGESRSANRRGPPIV